MSFENYASIKIIDNRGVLSYKNFHDYITNMKCHIYLFSKFSQGCAPNQACPTQVIVDMYLREIGPLNLEKDVRMYYNLLNIHQIFGKKINK